MVRHELARRDEWKFPPASLELNDAIAAAILFCDENKVDEATLILTRGDLLVLDYVVPQDAKSAQGVPIGKQLLLKSFAARRYLDQGPWELVTPPAETTADDVVAKLRAKEI